MKNVNSLKDLQEIELPLPESLYNWPNLDTFDKKKLSRLIIELERCSFFKLCSSSWAKGDEKKSRHAP